MRDSEQKTVNSVQRRFKIAGPSSVHYSLLTDHSSAGFTLIETLVAIALLTIGIVVPMSLTTQSLGAAYYARDQLIASELAQEGIEIVRHIRDGNLIYNNAYSPSSPTMYDVFSCLLPACQTLIYSADPPAVGEPKYPVSTAAKTYIVNVLDDFTRDTSTGLPASCGGSVPNLKFNGSFYFHVDPNTGGDPCKLGIGETFSPFNRTVKVEYVPKSGALSTDPAFDEVKVTSTVTWKTAYVPPGTITLTENIYRYEAEQ